MFCMLYMIVLRGFSLVTSYLGVKKDRTIQVTCQSLLHTHPASCSFARTLSKAPLQPKRTLSVVLVSLQTLDSTRQVHRGEEGEGLGGVGKQVATQTALPSPLEREQHTWSSGGRLSSFCNSIS